MNPDSSGAFEALGNKASTRANLRIRETELALRGGTVAHAIDFDGRPLLLVPLTDDQQGLDDDQSRGVSLHTRTLIDEATPRRFIAARCELPGLVATFGSLCDDLITALAADPLRPAETSLAILERWRELLGAPSNQLLSVGKLLGVLCELHLLEQLAQLAGSGAAMSAWTGPGSERQDFMSASVAIEVKGTSLRDRIAVEVHGLRQLEEPVGGRLFLWVEHVEDTTDDGDSVPDAIDRLALEGVSRHAVLTVLAPLGYVPSDEPAYRTVRFRLLDRRAYEVDASFPRLVPTSLLAPTDVDRLLNVRYTLDLTDRNANPRPMEFPVDAVTALAEAIR